MSAFDHYLDSDPDDPGFDDEDGAYEIVKVTAVDASRPARTAARRRRRAGPA
jgi:hypothetical protein